MSERTGRGGRRPKAEQAVTLKTERASKPVKPARAEIRPKKTADKVQEWPKIVRLFTHPPELDRETTDKNEKTHGEMNT